METKRLFLKAPAIRWRLIILLAASFAGFALPAHSQATGTQAQTPPKITDIIILGNKQINRPSILAASGLKIGDPATQEGLDRAKRLLLQMGNFGQRLAEPTDGVKVRAEVTEEGAKVVIEVDEND